QLAGRWDLAGTVLGKPAHYRAEGRWVLAQGWLELHLRDAAGAAGYEARVFIGYDAKAQQYIAHWLDRFGAAGAASGTLLLESQAPDGAWSTFARYRLRRLAPAAAGPAAPAVVP